MKPVERQKICSHCDGRIAVEADTCPYCGTPLVSQEEEASSAPLFGNQSLQESLTSLYTPPYSTRNAAFMKTEKENHNKFKTPLMKETSAENQFAGALGKMPYASPSIAAPEQKIEDKNSFLPLLFVLLGANLLTVGLLQCFFSDGGFLRLEWNSKYWFIYCLIALPLIYVGMKKAKQLNREPS
jgi:hypothetical protein